MLEQDKVRNPQNGESEGNHGSDKLDSKKDKVRNSLDQNFATS